jgi:hypothetical protein
LVDAAPFTGSPRSERRAFAEPLVAMLVAPLSLSFARSLARAS